MRAIATDALSIAIVRGAPMGCRVLLLLAMARLSSAGELNRAAYAIAIAEAVRIVVGGGVEVWAVRAISRARDIEGEEARTSSAMALVRLLFGFCGGLVAAALTGLSGDGSALLAVVAGGLVFAGESLAVPTLYHLARSSSGRLVPVSLFFAALVMACGIGLLLNGAGATAVCATVATGELLAGAYMLRGMRVAGVLVAFPGIVARGLSVIRDSMPATAYGGIVALYSRVDAVVLNAFSAAAFASYTVAFRATQPFYFVSGAVALAAYAHQMTRSAQPEELMRSAFRRLLAVIFAGATVAALLTYGVCALLISIAVPKYVDSLLPLRFLCATIPFVAANCVAQYALAGTARYAAMVGVAMVNLISTLVLLWVLVPMQGAQGAAMALLAAQVLNSAVLFIIGARPRSEAVPA